MRVEWLTAINPRPDIAFVWRVRGSSVDNTFTEAENVILQEYWPTLTNWKDLLSLLPTRSKASIASQASRCGIQRLPEYKNSIKEDFPRHVCWADLQVITNTSDALKMIRMAIEACHLDKKDLHGTWITPANGDALCWLVCVEHYENFKQYFDGESKPSTILFETALERANTIADYTIHIGDSYTLDVLGARAVGMIPVLLDRKHQVTQEQVDCLLIHSLSELLPLLEMEL